MTAPTSTYRLQIRQGFPLADAAALVDYLADLGVGALYLSPLLRSTTGSDHGYDTVDPTVLDPARGGDEGLRAVLTAARDAGLGVVVDIVPNHLGVEVPHENPAWWDVLTHGQGSAYADWFDVDWDRGPLVVPVLGDGAELSVVDGELRYFEHRYPLAPGTADDGADAETVHGRQHYRLTHFRRGNTDLNYRRFFAVTSLAGVRMEDRSVFDATHVRVRDMVAAGVAGLRVDHPDGLSDPGGYLTWLREAAPEAWITVEKILEPGEELPASWPVAGTTGYDALHEVGGLFVDPGAAEPLTDLYVRLTGDGRTVAEHVEAGKRMVVEQLLPAEVRRIAALAPDLPGTAAAVAELAVAFEVYRSYVPEVTAELDRALAAVADRRPDLRPTLDALGPRLRDPHDALAVRVQQLSGATMAKGVEDTAFYRHARFVAANEVGGNPAVLGVPVADFHAAQQRRLRRQPESMTGLSTHDTKRGEDVRARMAVLAEALGPWTAFAGRFLADGGVPNPAFAYFLAQNLVGVGPVDRARVHAYAEKAMREAAQDTGHVDPDAGFEAAVHAAVDRAYDAPALRSAWDALVELVTPPGWSNALGQKLVQLTVPGVPDVYQGTELWEDSLVDPDNRRPVDFAARRRLLGGLRQPPPLDGTGAAKLWLVSRVLRTRRDRPDLFGGYTPLTPAGERADHLVGFDRGGAVSVATRLPYALAGSGWGDTTVTLPDGDFTDLLTGRPARGAVAAADLLGTYPVAFLTRD